MPGRRIERGALVLAVVVAAAASAIARGLRKNAKRRLAIRDRREEVVVGTKWGIVTPPDRRQP
jgi:hypothetical protein